MCKNRFLVGLITAIILLGTSGVRANVGEEAAQKREVVAAVHTAASGLGAVLKEVSSSEAQIEIIRAFIEPVRFLADGSGYFIGTGVYLP